MLGTPILKNISPGWASQKVKKMKTFNILCLKVNFFVIVLYVNDLILIGDENLVKSWKEDLVRELEMKDLVLMHYFLGMEVWQGDQELFVSQGKYANEILKKLHMESNKPMENPLAEN